MVICFVIIYIIYFLKKKSGCLIIRLPQNPDYSQKQNHPDFEASGFWGNWILKHPDFESSGLFRPDFVSPDFFRPDFVGEPYTIAYIYPHTSICINLFICFVLFELLNPKYHT